MGDYLEVLVAKVRPEKRADFDAINRKVAEANRRAKGDSWLAMEVEYGEGNTIQFTSPRQNYAAIESAFAAFLGAIKEAYGPGGVPKMEQDFNNTIVSSHSEIRRRRWDLSVNGPKDAEAYNKIVGEARWLRTIQIRVRMGREADFEERVKEAKAAFEKGNESWSVFVSQVIAGAPDNTYYVTSLQPSLAAFDSAPKLRQLMGEETFASWQKAIGEDTITSEVMLMRMLPELSNVPEEITNVAPSFWKPKPKAVAAARPKPTPVETAKAGQ
jgi:hypothetical protein